MTNHTARNQYATAALKEQRAIVSGELAEIEAQARIKREALAHIDAVLKMFAPELAPDEIPARRPNRDEPYPIPGLSRRVLDALRCHAGPMAIRAVTDAIVAEMGFPAEAAASVQHRVRYSLRDLANRADGPIVKTGERFNAVWEVRR